jgi:hypothetical protein
MKHKSYLTAIPRKALPTPTRWLLKGEHVDALSPHVLDFGCGKCASVNPVAWTSYDPHFKPLDLSKLEGTFGRIICNYVLCTLPPEERIPVLRQIQKLLHVDGIAFVSVRNDRPKNGWGLTSKGTYQGRVRFPFLTEVYKNSQFRIYLLTKSDPLPTLVA